MAFEIPSFLQETETDCSKTHTWMAKFEAMLPALLTQVDAIRLEQIKSDSAIILRATAACGTIRYIKACPPGEETTSAIACLDENHHPQLVWCLHADIGNGVQILGDVPGQPLTPSDNATETLADVGKLLRTLHGLRTNEQMIPLSTWCHDLLHPAHDIPVSIAINIPRCLMLLETAPSHVWLHGDLHHANIIKSDVSGQLVAIDPKGIRGDASFDICTFIRNHVPPDIDDISLRTFLERRIRVIAEAAGYPLDRAFAWAAAGNALSLVWDLPTSGKLLSEDHRHMNRILTQLNALAEDNGMH